MVELARFVILRTVGELEIRHYPGMVVATVKGATESTAFDLLSKYIAGQNNIQQKIAMTAPVISTSSSMSFILPETYTKTNAPQPVDLRVTIEEMTDRDVAVLRFKGRTDEEDVVKHKEELLKTLNIQGIMTLGDAFLMRYNSPLTPGFLRRNEMGIELRP